MKPTNALHIVFTAALLCTARATVAQEPVRIRSGLVAGVRDGDLTVYKGIPYAAPPVGDLRWKPPEPAPHWDGVRAATTFGLPCPQPTAPGRAPVPPFVKEASEDCLTLNVWAPAAVPRKRLPVIVAIPGGGFYNGGSLDPRIDGGLLASQGVVVVSFNYRLGVFGFFAHPGLSKESPTGTSGNYGLMDQVAALRWVHDNIAAFSGDPDNVTISGSSAGGSSVLYLMVSPLARGLFARAAAQSSALVYGPLAHVREGRYGFESREAVGLRFGADVAALRALSADELLARATTLVGDPMFGDTNLWPMVDGAVLPDEPWALFESGRFAHVPLIIGTTTDEGSVFAFFGLHDKTVENWRAHLARRHPGVEAEVLATYPVAVDSNVYSAAMHWVNDWYFHGNARAIARAVSARGVPVFLYSFSRVPPSPPVRAVRFGAAHSAELDYVFSAPTPPQGIPIRYEEVDRALARTIRGAWVQFARTGDPNGPDLPAWPRYERSTDRNIEFDSEIRVESGLHSASLDVFDTTFAKMRAAYRKP